MKTFFTMIFLVNCILSKSQINYSGFIDKYPIQLVTYIYSDGDVRAVYAYDKFDTPIRIDGRRSGNTLALYERGNKNEITASIRFDNYSEKISNITGFWISRDSTKRLKVTLNKDFDIDNDKDFEQKEIIQSGSTKENYFKLLISKINGNARVKGVKVFEKKTDRLIQTIDLDCQLLGIDNISTADYNFDGLLDFSVFEASYSGPNTSSIYILRIPHSEQYVVSDFSGTSLEFDSGSKLIYEHNQSCAGRCQMNATYKVVDNKMILIEKKCTEYDENSGKFVDTKCE